MHLLDFHLCIVAGSVLSENPICELLGYGTKEQQLWVLVDTFGDFIGFLGGWNCRTKFVGVVNQEAPVAQSVSARYL